MTQYRHLILLLSLLISLFATAQDISTDFAKVNNNYAKHDKLSMNVTYSVVDKKTNVTLEKTEGYILKNGEQYCRKIGNTTSIVSATYNLVVNDDNNTIVLSPILNDKKEIPEISPEYITEMVKICTDIKREEIGNNLVKYTLKYSSFQYEKVVITIDIIHYFITEIAMYNKPFTDKSLNKTYDIISKISYTGINTSPEFKPNSFTYKNYLYKQFDEYKLQSKYSSYKFTNLFNQNPKK